jgi:hypothetical protein
MNGKQQYNVYFVSGGPFNIYVKIEIWIIQTASNLDINNYNLL